ncbi:MAG TPA: hypothetical protein VF142_16390 [Longimicrobium sp.]
MAVAALLLAACAGEEPVPDPSADSLAVAAEPVTPAQTPADSAVAAEAAKEGAASGEAPAAAAQDTGYTQWRPLEMPSEPWTQQAADPQALLTRVRDVVAAQLEEPDAGVLPTRMQVQAADSAVGILVHPDQADDSVRDVEFRLHMRRQGAGWAVVAVDRRERCRRGVAEGGLCA